MATKRISWSDGSGDHIALTYQGRGNGAITVESDPNNLANARSKTIVIETTAGSPVVTKNVTVTQPACPFPIGDVRNYAYTGTYQEVELPAGRYKLQCWGAQGGSNAAASSYGITAQAGGKGGYSEGVITLTEKTTVRIYVGGAGSSSAGGFNGGGSTSGSASYNSGDTQGVSRMGGGGGATDIRLSDGAMLTRMIVAGGGSGGAMVYRKKTEEIVEWEDVESFSSTNATGHTNSSYSGWSYYYNNAEGYLVDGETYRFIRRSGGTPTYIYMDFLRGGTWKGRRNLSLNSEFEWSNSYISDWVWIQMYIAFSTESDSGTIVLQKKSTSISESKNTNSQAGYAGGGTTGAGYSSTYQGKQNGAGSNGSFGQGANQTATNYRYCSGAGGGGWYGGGMNYSDSDMNACKMSGGGSGFVNTAANAGNRPSGYTGLELDSGATYAGNTSFESVSGGTETGHSGNGYARITRLS